MKISISSQLIQVALSWFLGFFSGFLYDAIRVIRRESGKAALSALLDALFCLAVCFGLFVEGMSAGEGSLSLAMLAFAFAGFCVYMLLLSDKVFSSLRKAFRKLKSCIAEIISPIRKILKFLTKKVKNIFSKIMDWFRMKYIVRKSNVQKKNFGGKASETEKSEYGSGHCDYGDDSLWHSQPYIEP